MVRQGKQHEHLLNAQMQTVALAELQSEILGEGELILDLYLGPDYSLLFAVDRQRITCRELPPAEVRSGPWMMRSSHISSGTSIIH
jgi:hypothetical protein